VLGIMGSQIEIKQIFSVVGVITNLRRSCLEIENLDRLIFVIKHWLEDTRVGCDGASKPMSMTNFLTSKSNIIEENNKVIEEQGLFEEDLDFNF
jgi:hypothetical protein